MARAAAPACEQMIPVKNLRFSRLVRNAVLTAACMVLAIAAGCATTKPPPAPSLEEIVQMSVDGVSDDEIITRLKKSGAVYPLTASGIVDLSCQGVSLAVLDYMQASLIENARRQGHMLYGEPFWGYPCADCRYPTWRVPPYNFPF